MSAIREGEVRPGKCFTSKSDGRVRRVISLRDGTVTFETRRGKGGRVEWDAHAQAPIADFLAELHREVGCDHQP